MQQNAPNNAMSKISEHHVLILVLPRWKSKNKHFPRKISPKNSLTSLDFRSIPWHS